MELLKETIRAKGKVLTKDILDVSDFLNAQVDPKLMQAIGEEFAEYYKDYTFDAFVTVEASGIAPSVFASLAADKPLIIIKKSDKELAADKFAQQPSHSYTKDNDYFLTVKKDLIQGKRLILIDDFLASGSVVTNVKSLLENQGSELVATGILITKSFQKGYLCLEEAGHDLYSLAEIESLNPEDGSIEFMNRK